MKFNRDAKILLIIIGMLTAMIVSAYLIIYDGSIY